LQALFAFSAILSFAMTLFHKLWRIWGFPQLAFVGKLIFAEEPFLLCTKLFYAKKFFIYPVTHPFFLSHH
jgi:hypothetical protein